MKSCLICFSKSVAKKINERFKEYSFSNNIRKSYDYIAFAILGDRVKTEHIIQMYSMNKPCPDKKLVVFLVSDFGVERVGGKKGLFSHMNSTTKTSNIFFLDRIHMEDD